MENPKPKEQLKFYADSPDGVAVNKYFCYPTFDLNHSCDVAGKFLKQGFKIRAAYHVYANGKSIRIPTAMIENVKDLPYYQQFRKEQNDWETLKEIQKAGRKVAIPKPNKE